MSIQMEEPVQLTVGELKKALQGLSNDTPVYHEEFGAITPS
jgi:hypothetical protein